jgi:hypothetical protein
MKELHYFDILDRSHNPDKYKINRNKRLYKFRTFASSTWLGINGQRNLTEDLKFWWKYFQMDGSIDWYKSLFEAPSKSGKETGDITPAYSTLTEPSIQRLKELQPNLKIIFILRNPIDRSFSQVARRLFSQRGTQMSNVSNQEILDILSSEDCLSRSDYLTILERYNKYFSDEYIFIGFFEEIKICPHDLLSRICKFIGVQPLSESEVTKESPNSRSSLLGKIQPEILRFLVDVHGPTIEEMSIRFGSYAEQWYRELLEYRSVLMNR